MAEIEIETPSGTIPALLEVPEGVVPEGGGPWPSVVIVHDVFGMNEDIENIARRFAGQGYVALVPDLYARGGRAKCVVGVFRALLGQQGPAVEDLLAARDSLVARADTTDRVGIVGFCMGGGFALLLSPKGFEASAPFYGISPKHIEETLADACPVVASYGRRDPSLVGAGPKLEKVLRENGVEHDVKTYSGAGHSFANDKRGGISGALLRVSGFGYQPEQAEDAFSRVFAFFGEKLRAQ